MHVTVAPLSSSPYRVVPSTVHTPTQHPALLLLLLCLATYRLCKFVIDDHLVANYVTAVQDFFEARWERGHPTLTPDAPLSDEWQSKPAYLLSCPWCLSVWFGTALTLGVGGPWALDLPWTFLLLAAITTSTASGLIATAEHAVSTWADYYQLHNARLKREDESGS